MNKVPTSCREYFSSVSAWLVRSPPDGGGECHRSDGNAGGPRQSQGGSHLRLYLFSKPPFYTAPLPALDQLHQLSLLGTAGGVSR